MKEVSNTTFCVLDHGLFFSMAERLAREAKRVLYWTPNDSPFPVPNPSVIGDGFKSINVERIAEFWPLKNEIDVFAVPDIGMAEIQVELVSQGKPVWGARRGENIELKRAMFKKLQSELGMNVPEYQIIRGLDNLREFLKSHGECYIKISRWRGISETHKHVSYDLSVEWLNGLAVKLGPLAKHFQFIVEEPLDAIIELGIDSYNMRGKFPRRVIQAKEGKDKCCISTIRDYEELEDGFREMHDLLTPWFEETGYQGDFSSEGRATEDGKWHMTDPTCRQATPCGEPVLEMTSNFPEVVNAGAYGELLEPEYEEEFAVQALIDHPGDEEGWRAIEVPDSIARWVKIYCPMKEGGLIHVPPFSWSTETVGSVLATGKSIQEAYDSLLEHVKALDGQGLCIHTDSIADALKEIQGAEEHEIPFTDKIVPEPEIVIQ